MTQHMAESYRQLSEVLGNRISIPSAASSEGGADSSYSPTYDVPSDNDDNLDEVMDRNDWDDDKKRAKMNKMFSRAVSSGDVDRVTQLLSNDRTKEYIDVNAKDEDGATPLIYAACFGKVEIAQALLEAGAKTDIQDSSGWSALMWATTNKHESIVKVLMDHGASAQTRSAKGRTVFDFVQSSNSNEKIAEILATNPRDSLSSSMSCTSSSAGDCDFYYQSTVEGYDSFMAEEAERRQKLLETAMALVGGDSTLIDNTHDDDDTDAENDLYDNNLDDDDQEDDDQDDLTTEFYWDKCMPDQMFVFGGDDLTHILDTMITNIRLPMETQQEICVPANVVFLSARFAHYFSSSELLDEVLEGALSRMSQIAKENARNTDALAFWMSNQVQLLYYLKKDTGLVVATAEYQLRLSEMISETYTMLIINTERQLLKMLIPAMLHYEQISGMEHVDFSDDWQRFFRRNNNNNNNNNMPMRRSASSPGSNIPNQPILCSDEDSAISPECVTDLLESIFTALQTYEVHPTIMIQVLAQLVHFMSCELFNRILINKKMLSRSKALQVRMNLSYVEDWIRHNHLPASLLSYLNPTTQLLQLLQCLSHLSDFESFVQTVQKFDSLNALQVKRCIVNYRYEVNEPRVPDAIKDYVLQIADDAVKYKQQRRNTMLRRSKTSMSRVGSFASSMQRSRSRPESVSSFVGSIIGRVSLPPTPTTEDLPKEPSTDEPHEDDQEAEEDDQDMHEMRDTKFMLPFSVPTTAHMVSIKGWVPDGTAQQRRCVTPIIPDNWMEKLDKANYAQ
ncbi:hypothetical protein K492DRAFT_212796 [Lichtheimia hyalospora FSU 10163]|nr:hypothetical protein K492DRAFT_212796 [Lichtheimia hyalospora FSU 10163]